MNSSRLDQALGLYQARIAKLEEQARDLPLELVLEVFSTRDAVQEALEGKTRHPVESYCELIALDVRLRKHESRIARLLQKTNWIESLQPPEDAWWWRLEEPASRYEWLWNLFTILLLIISLSFLATLARRFLSGEPDLWGTFLVVLQSVFTALVAGGALTRFGKEPAQRIISNVGLPRSSWRLVQIALMGLSSFILFVSYRSLPGFAVRYNESGSAHYTSGRYAEAQADFKRAVMLDPSYTLAHYNLGSLYEDLQDIENAKTEYQIAAVGGLDAAYNNLARLYILDNNEPAAVTLIFEGLEKAQSPEVQYNLYKNLGWARLKQKRYADAEAVLYQATGLLNEQKAPAHCLLAQALQAQGEEAEARVEWRKCVELASSLIPEEDEWLSIGHKYLQEQAE